MRYALSIIAGGILGRWIYTTGAEVAQWSDEAQIDYVLLPLLACLLPYAVVVSVLLIAVGNGWASNKKGPNDES